MQQPSLFQIGHDVAHRGGGEAVVQAPRQGTRADGGAGFKKRFHHLAENLAIALIQGADFRLICRSQCHSGMNVVRGWEGVNDALDVGLDVSPVGR